MCHCGNKTTFKRSNRRSARPNENGPGARPGPFPKEATTPCGRRLRFSDQVLSPRTLRMKSLEFEVAEPPLEDGTVWAP